MRIGGKVLRAGAVAVLAIVAGFGAWTAWVAQPAEPRFCTLALAIAVIDGQEVVLQDGGQPGPDGCDNGETMPKTRVLGLDCKIREADGDVVAELVPNRADGTCGRPGPADSLPDPWPHR